MPNRRDFLKLFGIGSTIAPVAAGVLIPDVTARLVEPAKVELIDKPVSALPTPMDDRRFTTLMGMPVHVDMVIRPMVEKVTWHVRGQAALLEITPHRPEIVDVTRPGDPWTQFIPVFDPRFEWTVRGEFLAFDQGPTISL